MKGVTALADFRLSAQVIGRSDGRSATAAAAYRASERVECQRTGLTHDYSRKGGTLHEEIMTPDNTPEWMRDRDQLWNAVEKVERRKDAQLAREVQLSLPNELNPEQRLTLVRDFVADQFVSKGMIADIAIHAPNEKGDERNHHAHIMLTMRDITADGFGKKNRDWNKPQVLENWREQWANHQNQSLERHGHSERVDHRSYAEQGIDKQPQQHRGTTATEMERKTTHKFNVASEAKEPTRIEKKNNEIHNDNMELAKLQAQHAAVSAQIAAEKDKLRQWSEAKRDKFERAVKATQQEREAIQTQERLHLEQKLNRENANAKNAIQKQVNDLNYKLSKSFGIRGLIRTVTGQNKRDRASITELEKSAYAIAQTENSRRNTLKASHLVQNRQAEKRAIKGRSKVNAQIIQKRDQLQEKIDQRFAEQEKPQALKSSFKSASTQANENKSTRPQGRQSGRQQGRQQGRGGDRKNE